jgi:hypothetical protein
MSTPLEQWLLSLSADRLSGIDSRSDLGLLTPITVTRDRRLVSGLHRLAAFKALGRRTIPAVVIAVSRDEAQLSEIDRKPGEK